MKKLLLLSTVLLGTAVASRAGVDIHIGLPLPPLPRIVIGHPAPPVIVHPRVYAPRVVVAPPHVVYGPPVVCAPPPRIVYAPVYHGHRHGYRDYRPHHRHGHSHGHGHGHRR